MTFFKTDKEIERKALADKQAKEASDALREGAKVQAKVDEANRDIAAAEEAKEDATAERVGLQPDDGRATNDAEARRRFGSPDELAQDEKDRQDKQKLAELGRKKPFKMKQVGDVKRAAAKNIDSNIQQSIDDAAADGKSSLTVEGKLDKEISNALHRAGYQLSEPAMGPGQEPKTMISWET